MKAIIDITKEMVEYVEQGGCSFFYAYHDTDDFYDCLKNGIIVPENATNGDVMKAVFPSTVKEVLGRFVYSIITIDSSGNKHSYSKDWWDAPYGGDANVNDK